jgi:transposase
MVVGVILDEHGQPVCCEMWPGNTADVTTLVPVIKRLRSRFGIGRICVVSDRGMISAETMAYLEEEKISYILGARMRRSNEVKEEVLSRAGRYREVHPEGHPQKTLPAEGQGSGVTGWPSLHRMPHEKQARKDAADRQAILDSLLEKLKNNPKSLVGNKGYRKYLKLNRDTVAVNQEKIEEEARYDGKWVLKTNTTLTAEQPPLKYKERWQVEQVFRDMKSVLDTRPIFHKVDETIRGHVFCSFWPGHPEELDRRLAKAGHCFEMGRHQAGSQGTSGKSRLRTGARRSP